MKTKHNKISLISIIVFISIAILVAISWATVTSNAFASNDEVIFYDEHNELYKVTAKIVPEGLPDDICVLSHLTRKINIDYFYCVSTQQSIDGNLKIDYYTPSGVSGSAAKADVNSAKAKEYGYELEGFYVNNSPATVGKTWRENIDVEVRFKVASPTTTVKGKAYYSGGGFTDAAIANATYTDPETQETVIKQGTIDAAGNFEIKEVPQDIDMSVVVQQGRFYWSTDIHTGSDPEYIIQEQIFLPLHTLVKLLANEASLGSMIFADLSTQDESTLDWDDPEFMLSYGPLQYDIEGDSIYLWDEMAGSTKDNPAYKLYAKPVDGYEVESITAERLPIDQNELLYDTQFSINFKQASAEDINAVPQTGDSAPLVPFVLLAVLAGGVLLYTRKASRK